MNHENALVSQLVQNEQRIGRAISKRDVTVLEELVAEDFVGTTPDGTVLTKRDVVATLFLPAYEIDEFENTDVQVRAYGHAAVVVGRGVVRRSIPRTGCERTVSIHARLAAAGSAMVCRRGAFVDAATGRAG
jgi:hypothetical protein